MHGGKSWSTSWWYFWCGHFFLCKFTRCCVKEKGDLRVRRKVYLVSCKGITYVRLAFLVPEVETVRLLRFLSLGCCTMDVKHFFLLICFEVRAGQIAHLSRGQCFPCNGPSRRFSTMDGSGTYSTFLFFQRRSFPTRNVYILVYIIHGILKMRVDEIILSHR